MRIVLPLLMLLQTSASAQSLDLAIVEAKTESRTYQLCSSWRYDGASGGYLCGFYDYVDVADQDDLDTLQQTIRDLEARVRALETELSRRL